MSKKHFIAIANDFRLALSQGADIRGAELIASHLCDTFKRGNPDFDRERFLTACGF